MLKPNTSPSRRAIFGLLAVPVLGIAACMPAPAIRFRERAQWNATFAKWQKLETMANTVGGETVEDAELAEWQRLILMPSPDQKALLWKMEYLWGHSDTDDGHCDSWSTDIVKVVLQDARRLLGSAPAPWEAGNA